MGGVVAQKQSQAFLVDAIRREAVVLERERSLHEPVGLGHFADEQFFGRVGGLVVIEQVLEQRFEGGGIFAGDDELAGGESMFEGITRRSQFAFWRDRAGGMGGVGTVASGDALAQYLSFLDEFGGEFGFERVSGGTRYGLSGSEALLLPFQFLLFALGRAADGSWRHTGVLLVGR